MYILKQIIKLIRLLHAEEGSFNIALAFSLSLFPGFAGFMSIFGLITILMVVFFRIQMGAYFLGYFFFSLLSLALLGPMNRLGHAILLEPSLDGLWTTFYDWPLMHWLNYNHTLVMGGQLLAIVLFPFSLVLLNYLVQKYQRTVVQKLKNTKLYKNFERSTFFINYGNILKSL